MPSSGDLSNPRIECNSPASPALQVDSLTAEPLGKSNYMYKKFILRSMCKNQRGSFVVESVVESSQHNAGLTTVKTQDEGRIKQVSSHTAVLRLYLTDGTQKGNMACQRSPALGKNGSDQGLVIGQERPWASMILTALPSQQIQRCDSWRLSLSCAPWSKLP